MTDLGLTRKKFFKGRNMAIRVFIPAPLRPYTKGNAAVTLDGSTVAEILASLASHFPYLKTHLFDDLGELRSFVNIYVNEEDIRYLQREDTKVQDGDEIRIVPAVAGGRPELEQASLDAELSHEEIRRYSRHLIMPEVALSGQKKLRAARVLLIGAGGLGSPVAIYLAAAGVGHLGLVDFDVVEESNLQRQVIYSTHDVGRPKLESAEECLRGINPHIKIKTYETRLSSENALDIFKDYDIVVDGTDNFPTRYLVNDACVLLGKPNVYGSIFRFDGQATVFDARSGPCYRCLYGTPPPPGLVPSCAEGGVLGVLAGLVGVIQANETIKLILGQGETLLGRLLLIDALTMTFRELALRKNPDCPICGENPTIRELIDYEEFCGVADERAVSPGKEWETTPAQLRERLNRGEKIRLLDVREPQEWEICHLSEATLIPLRDLPSRLSELNSMDRIVVYCKTGKRSAEALSLLRSAGFHKVENLAGGIDAWAKEVDPTIPRY